MELADTSAWTNREKDPGVYADFRRRVIDGLIATCPMVVFELLWSARHHRRVKIGDLLIAAAAERAALTVCHYNRDFETIAEVTGQPIRAIAPLGSLG